MYRIISIIFVLFLCSAKNETFSQCELGYELGASNGKIWTKRTSYNFFYENCKDLIESYRGKAYIHHSVEEIININKKKYIDQFKMSSDINRDCLIINNFDYYLSSLFKTDTNLFFNIVDSYIENESSFDIQIKVAEILLHDSNKQRAINYLKRLLTSDTCRKLLLEVAFSLSYLGEKEVPLRLIEQLLSTDSTSVFDNNFSKVNETLRNINNSESVVLLEKLAKCENPYCNVDAIACLYQLKEFEIGFNCSIFLLEKKPNKYIATALLLLNYYYIFNSERKDILVKKSCLNSDYKLIDCFENLFK